MQGAVADAFSDIIILADEDPRGEDPVRILEEIASGCPTRTREKDLFLIPDRAAAIRKSFRLAREGDTVLLLGKGHETSIEYHDHTLRWDETEEARTALSELGYG